MLVKYLESRAIFYGGWGDSDEDENDDSGSSGSSGLKTQYIVIIVLAVIFVLAVFAFGCYRSRKVKSGQINGLFVRRPNTQRPMQRPMQQQRQHMAPVPVPNINVNGPTERSEYTDPTLDPPPLYMVKSTDVTIGEGSVTGGTLLLNPPQDEYSRPNTPPPDAPVYQPPEGPPPVHLKP